MISLVVLVLAGAAGGFCMASMGRLSEMRTGQHGNNAVWTPSGLAGGVIGASAVVLPIWIGFRGRIREPHSGGVIAAAWWASFLGFMNGASLSTAACTLLASLLCALGFLAFRRLHGQRSRTATPASPEP
jgi:hypothetical protein